MSRTKVHVLSMIVLALAFSLCAPVWGENQGACSMAGTWYGGGDVAKYMTHIYPAAGNDFRILGEGAFSQVTLGFPVMTSYGGSIIKNQHGYEAYSIGMVNDTTNFPAPTPQVFAVHAAVRLIDCDTLRFDYDFFGAYLWNSNKIPFVDKPDYVVVPPPFSETYRRMPTRCPQCEKH